jgi:UDP-N-acetylglucosamine--N-acetylmuramyl-(pentapeptide) pyrophosphoryl-undecaprenol N-acetylglucosamine transferase
MRSVVTLVAGGTAGHIEPALAVANWLRQEHPEVKCEFIGTASGLESVLVPQAGFPLRIIKKAPMPRKLSLSALLWPIRLMQALDQTFRALGSSSVVVGFGGYVAAPAYVAAKLLRIPILIHEQNSKPGWANNLGSNLTSNLAVAFDGARTHGAKWKVAELVGMPLRNNIVEVASLSETERLAMRDKLCSEIGFDRSKPIVFIFGGSQGAKRINETIRDARSELELRGIQVIHGVGKTEPLPARSETYLPLDYISNMAVFYAAADLVIARSGAVTCAEVAAVQDYALFIPLPIGNGEQSANALELVSGNRAEIIENSHITSEWLMGNIDRLLESGRQLATVRTPIVPLNSAKILGEWVIKLHTHSSVRSN